MYAGDSWFRGHCLRSRLPTLPVQSHYRRSLSRLLASSMPPVFMEPPPVFAASVPPLLGPGRQYTTQGLEQWLISMRRQDAFSEGSHGVIDSSSAGSQRGPGAAHSVLFVFISHPSGPAMNATERTPMRQAHFGIGYNLP